MTPETPGLGRLKQRITRTDAELVQEVSSGFYEGRSSIPRTELGADLWDVDPAEAWYRGVLRGAHPRPTKRPSGELTILDIFSGTGGMSAGLVQAAAAAGINASLLGCVDTDPAAVEVFSKNLSPRLPLRKNVDALVEYALRFDKEVPRFAYPPELVDPLLGEEIGRVNVVAGGPPCQGHSNLNNHTRRSDPRNSLYLAVPAIAIALEAEAVIIENVPAVRRDRNRVVEKAKALLEEYYYVTEAVLESNRLGVAQQRKRHFLVATRNSVAPLERLYEALSPPALTVMDAIEDLQDVSVSSPFDQPSALSSQNQKRIAYLFQQGTHNLPDDIRPECHQDGHTYPSVYGRMFEGRSAQTITGGFLSPGRGRFVHPTRERGLTPHEGARLQGFPDSFSFSRKDGEPLTRTDMAKLIGNAVPPPMAYAVGLACISTLLKNES